MKKSDEMPKLDKLPDVDYSKISKDVGKAITQEPYIIKKKSKISWDGRQFLTRIPSEISTEMNITKESKFLFTVEKPLPGSDEEVKLKIELL